MVSFLISNIKELLWYLSSISLCSFIYLSEIGIKGVCLNSSTGIRLGRNLWGCSFSIVPGKFILIV